jgi:hypothetical protein
MNNETTDVLVNFKIQKYLTMEPILVKELIIMNLHNK